MSDNWMTSKKLGLKNLRESLVRRGLERDYLKRNRKDVLIYSQAKGIYYSVLFSILLWWIPIAGPAIAGYIGGRKSGSTSKALTSSLISTSVILMITFMLAPFQTGIPGGANTYFSSGVLTLSQSRLIAYSGILTDMYTGYGLIKTFTIILPGSLLIMNIFGYTGGFISTFKRQEDGLSYSYISKNVDDRIRTIRSVPKVQASRRLIREFTDGTNEEEDGVGGWSYL